MKQRAWLPSQPHLIALHLRMIYFRPALMAWWYYRLPEEQQGSEALDVTPPMAQKMPGNSWGYPKSIRAPPQEIRRTGFKTPVVATKCMDTRLPPFNSRHFIIRAAQPRQLLYRWVDYYSDFFDDACYSPSRNSRRLTWRRQSVIWHTTTQTAANSLARSILVTLAKSRLPVAKFCL